MDVIRTIDRILRAAGFGEADVITAQRDPAGFVGGAVYAGVTFIMTWAWQLYDVRVAVTEIDEDGQPVEYLITAEQWLPPQFGLHLHEWDIDRGEGGEWESIEEFVTDWTSEKAFLRWLAGIRKPCRECMGEGCESCQGDGRLDLNEIPPHAKAGYRKVTERVERTCGHFTLIATYISTIAAYRKHEALCEHLFSTPCERCAARAKEQTA